MLTLPNSHIISFEQSLTAQGIARLDEAFQSYLQQEHPQAFATLEKIRSTSPLAPLGYSEAILELAPILESFLLQAFSIEKEALAQQQNWLLLHPIFEFKNQFILKRVRRRLTEEAVPPFEAIHAQLLQALSLTEEPDLEATLAAHTLQLLALNDTDALTLIENWCLSALKTKEGQHFTQHWPSLKLPKRKDVQALIPLKIAYDTPAIRLETEAPIKKRDGFALTDKRMNEPDVMSEVDYCVYCHDHDGDFCSKGFPEKKGNPLLGFKKDGLDNLLHGCPLEEKISEMNVLKRQGLSIAPLAVIMIDNPMCPATGHRICNDCMKACIYQKQDPVNIPQIETRILTDVLRLPWGVEIYDLLTRWNPLRRTQWALQPYNGKNVAVVGMGPAGFTMAHHLTQEGCYVTGIDGLKMEPLPQAWLNAPIHDFNTLWESLESRTMSGFGGVTEYGITVRWDKNFLRLIYLSLLRRQLFSVYGGVRFGGALRLEDLFHLGFHHVTLAVGAGLPNALNVSNSLAKGMRQAADFLMALQLTGASQSDTIASLQVRLPAVVIGGGLTGVDAATEMQAYYIKQVLEIDERYHTIAKTRGTHAVRDLLRADELEILDEYLAHAKVLKTISDPVARIEKIRQWGGVTIAYRKRMQDSPAYRSNHEELMLALREGIFYLENANPLDAITDNNGRVIAMRFECDNQEFELPAKTVLIATGAKPNVAYAFEHGDDLNRKGFQYIPHRENEAGELEAVPEIGHIKSEPSPFTSYQLHDKRVTFLGDVNPQFHGNVVKAIASSKIIYPEILKSLARLNPSEMKVMDFKTKIANEMKTEVIAVEKVHDRVVCLTIHAPLQAARFKPGMFFRLQTYQTSGHLKGLTETLPMLAFDKDAVAQTLKLLVWNKGASTALLQALKPNTPIVLMGPTGVRSKIPHDHQTVMIIATGFEWAYVLAVGPELRANGNRVLVFLEAAHESDLFWLEKLQQACDVLVINILKGFESASRRQGSNNRSLHVVNEDCENRSQHPCGFKDEEYIVDKKLSHSLKLREHDHLYAGTLMESLQSYIKEKNPHIPLHEVQRVSVMAEPQLVMQFQQARKTFLKEVLSAHKIFASTAGPMQCMMKGVCAQCLQWQIDPTTGLRTKAVFSCSWQDEPIDVIDLEHLQARQEMNQIQDTVNRVWGELN